MTRIGLLGTAMVVATTHAAAIPPPPPPPEVQAEIDRQCRTPPAEAIALGQTAAAPMRVPKGMRVDWAVRLDPPAGAHLGRVIGLATNPNGSRLRAATDKGYWIAVSHPARRSGAPAEPPMAVSIRGLPGPPDHMGLAGDTTGQVWLSTPAAITRYTIFDCFPGASPEPAFALDEGETVRRIDPHGEGADIVFARADGSLWRENVPRWRTVAAATHLVPEERLLGPAARASVGGRIPLARGCDELSLTSTAEGTEATTSCSQSYLSDVAHMQTQPQKHHRQPIAIRQARTIGVFEAPIVAMTSELRDDGSLAPVVRIGDRTNPGGGCSLFMAAQDAPDAAISIYAVRTYCAYYPRAPHGAPDPPPPAP